MMTLENPDLKAFNVFVRLNGIPILKANLIRNVQSKSILKTYSQDNKKLSIGIFLRKLI